MTNPNGVFTYPSPDGYFNIGDYVQSIAAKQFYTGRIEFLNRDFLNEHTGNKTNVIMNGWFTHYPQNWPPAKTINPLFVSFHLNKTKEKQFFSSATIEYLKQNGPIGCRDLTTLEIMRNKGIEANYTGCLTLTLGRSFKNENLPESGEILLVDPLFNLPSLKSAFASTKSLIKNGILKGFILKGNEKKKKLKGALGDKILNDGVYIENMIRDNISEEKKFSLAEAYLLRLSKAELVITSRIHCALPCMAMGTPVVFIDSFNHIADLSRFKGITNLFPTTTLEELLEVEEENKMDYLKQLSKSKSLNKKMVSELEKEVLNFLN